MENITLKEFKETLKGTQFEGFNLEDVLNALSIFCDHQAKEYKQKGLMVLSEYSEKKNAQTIYKRLRAKGYYNK